MFLLGPNSKDYWRISIVGNEKLRIAQFKQEITTKQNVTYKEAKNISL